MSVPHADGTARFWKARLLPFELLLPPTRFSARLVSASWLVAFVHLVRGPGIFISDHLGGFTVKEGLFMFASKGSKALSPRRKDTAVDSAMMPPTVPRMMLPTVPRYVAHHSRMISPGVLSVPRKGVQRAAQRKAPPKRDRKPFNSLFTLPRGTTRACDGNVRQGARLGLVTFLVTHSHAVTQV